LTDPCRGQWNKVADAPFIDDDDDALSPSNEIKLSALGVIELWIRRAKLVSLEQDEKAILASYSPVHEPSRDVKIHERLKSMVSHRIGSVSLNNLCFFVVFTGMLPCRSPPIGSERRSNSRHSRGH
jgi:hypothetical protein